METEGTQREHIRVCEVCGRKEILPFKCDYCEGTFCGEHHLPENHSCSFQPKVPTPYVGIKRGVHVSREVADELKSLEERESIGPRRPRTKRRSARNKALFLLVPLTIFACVFLIMSVYLSPPPTITILSPQATTYRTNSIHLTYTSSKQPFLGSYSLSYSLDGQANKTLEGNTTTLARLLDGLHSVVIYASNIVRTVVVGVVYFTVDATPPVITIISPETTIYNTTSNAYAVDLACIINEPISWMGYSLNGGETVAPTGNITLNLLPGRHNLTIYANDTVGNTGFSKVVFTVSKVFSSLTELKNFLIADNLSDAEWTVNYTCHEFAEDFIKIAELKGYYIFTYYALGGDEMAKFASIEIIVPGYYPWKPYWQSYLDDPDAGHAVVRATIGVMNVIIDPQTDIILTYPDFTVLYEGEITQD